MVKLQVILGSTRPGRLGEQVAKWVYESAQNRNDFEAEYVDVVDYNLPLLDEPMPASTGQYIKDHTKKWSEKIASADGFIFITGEYNHSIPAALKNAIDYLFKEWNNKAAGFVSYGSTANGQRSVEQLRQVMAEIKIADVRAQVSFNISRDFEGYKTLTTPSESQAKQLNVLFDELVAWSIAMKQVRSSASS